MRMWIDRRALPTNRKNSPVVSSSGANSVRTVTLVSVAIRRHPPPGCTADRGACGADGRCPTHAQGTRRSRQGCPAHRGARRRGRRRRTLLRPSAAASPKLRRPDTRNAVAANGFRVFTLRSSVYAPPARAARIRHRLPGRTRGGSGTGQDERVAPPDGGGAATTGHPADRGNGLDHAGDECLDGANHGLPDDDEQADAEGSNR